MGSAERHAEFVKTARAIEVRDEDVRPGDMLEWGFCREWARVVAVEPYVGPFVGVNCGVAVTTHGRISLCHDRHSWVVR